MHLSLTDTVPAHGSTVQTVSCTANLHSSLRFRRTLGDSVSDLSGTTSLMYCTVVMTSRRLFGDRLETTWKFDHQTEDEAPGPI